MPRTQLSARSAVLPAIGAAVIAAVGWTSGLPLSSASTSPDGVRLVGDAGGAVLTVTDLPPGGSVSRTVSISNPGDEPRRLTMTESAAPATWGGGDLRLVISRDGHRLYAGSFGGMTDLALDQGSIEAGSSTTYTFTVSRPESGEIVSPGTQTATAAYVWDTTP